MAKPLRLNRQISRGRVSAAHWGEPMSEIRFSIKTFELRHGKIELVTCAAGGELSLDEFVQQVEDLVVPKLSGDDTVLVRGDNLPDEYLAALANAMRKTDFPVIGKYDLDSGKYLVYHSDNVGQDEEIGDVIPDPERNP